MIVIDPANSQHYHTLDKELEQALRESAQVCGLTFKSYVIRLLRAGIVYKVEPKIDQKLIRRN